MKYGVVYRITNLEDGKCYIGRTKNELRKRWDQHCRVSSNCLYLKRAIEKYGKENFSIHEIASSWDPENLKVLEMQLIQQENTISPNGYNLVNTGEGVAEVSEETRVRLQQSNRGRTHTAESRQKISEAHKGKPKTEKHRQSMSRTRIGRPSRMKGCKFSEDARKNMGGQNRGKTASDETKAKMRAVRTGLKWYTDGIRDCRLQDSDEVPSGFRPGRTGGLQNLPIVGCRGFVKTASRLA